MKKRKKRMIKFKPAPLPSAFMITAILGIALSAYWLYPKSPNFGIAALAVFLMMLIASIINMTVAPIKDEFTKA